MDVTLPKSVSWKTKFSFDGAAFGAANTAFWNCPGTDSPSILTAVIPDSEKGRTIVPPRIAIPLEGLLSIQTWTLYSRFTFMGTRSGLRVTLTWDAWRDWLISAR